MTCTCVGDTYSSECPIPQHAAAARDAAIGDTGWKPIRAVGGIMGEDGQAAAGKGVIDMVRGNESRPCAMCRSWIKDNTKLIQHLISKKMEMQPDGTFKSPIRKDFKDNRANLTINPKNFGFCRFETRVTEDLASCENWTPVTTASELADRIHAIKNAR